LCFGIFAAAAPGPSPQPIRNRRPGRTIAVPEPQLTPVEKTISAVGDFSVPSIAFLDAALRRLAASQTTAQQGCRQ
jgi:hypothetical protein